jgi:predicted transcriptional regulator
VVFSVLENPIRRKILSKLAKEQHYPLQLSKELNISQQAIMKHLKVLEDNGLVVSFEERSTLGGPPRKSYVSKKHISLRIDIGPNTFNTEMFDYKEMEENENSKETVEKQEVEYENFIEDYEKSEFIEDPSNKLSELSKIIKNINNELDNLKYKRSKLLTLREHVARESNKIITELCREYDERKIVYYLLSHPESDIPTISEAMEMRERVIEEIFKNLMRHRILIDYND